MKFAIFCGKHHHPSKTSLDLRGFWRGSVFGRDAGYSSVFSNGGIESSLFSLNRDYFFCRLGN